MSTYEHHVSQYGQVGKDRASETLAKVPKDRQLTDVQRGQLHAVSLLGDDVQQREALRRLEADDKRRGSK